MNSARYPWTVPMSGTAITIREERTGDFEAIRALNEQAFGQPLESRIVDRLRAQGAALLSLVATLDGRVVGHALYSPVAIGSGRNEVTGAGLGPMAVLPELQRHGIGRQLVVAGNRILQERGWPFVVVLGHAGYYPRFGFEPASRHGIRCEWDVPDNVFMVKILDPAGLKNISGVARYRPEFSDAG